MNRKTWFRIVRFALIFYLVVLILMVWFERYLVYPTPPKAEGTWDSALFGAEDVFFQSADGTRLHGWYFHHPDAGSALLFCHGNGTHLGYMGAGMAELSARLNASVFAFDYRGYGLSEGKPHERGVLQDAEAARAWLAKHTSILEADIAIYGRSLGGGVAAHLASVTAPQVLILERTFHSMVDIGAKQYPWLPVKLIMKNRYPSEDRIADFQGVLLQLHGSDDRLVPLESAKRLFQACPSKFKQFVEVPGMGHNAPTPKTFFDIVAAALNTTPESASQ